jgi:hypothetical protein
MFTSKPKMKVFLFLYRIDGTLPALSILNDEQTETFNLKSLTICSPGTTERKKEQRKQNENRNRKEHRKVGKKEGKSEIWMVEGCKGWREGARDWARVQ